MIDPLEGYPGYLLRRASALSMTRLAKRLKTLGLSPSEATVLAVIQANPGAKQADVGRLLDIARANMAPLIARLAARNLVDRKPLDKRSHGLILSRAGQDLTMKAKKIFMEHEAALTAAIPRSQRTAFIAGLRALLEQR